MEQPDTDDRLSRIETQWTAVLRAHGQSIAGAKSARGNLLLRYSGAVYRYLLGSVRDPDVRIAISARSSRSGSCAAISTASRPKGRFRDYVKIALVNLANDHHRARQAGPQALAIDVAAPELPSEDDFVGGWRQSILDQTWKALAEENPTFHAVLQLRIENPEMSSGEVAERISAQLGKPMTAENVRKSLQRATPSSPSSCSTRWPIPSTTPPWRNWRANSKHSIVAIVRSALDKRREKK